MNLDCPSCLTPIGDDPHWASVLACWICSDCCDPCHQFSDGSGPEPDDSDRDLLPGGHDTPSATRPAGAAVSAAIRIPYERGAL